jgi:hypothetical protein
MDNDAKRCKWNKPLSKGDFYLYQLGKHIEIYIAVGFIVFVLGIATAGQAIYDFLSGVKYYGVDKAFYSILCFVVGRGVIRKFGELREEQRRIQNEVVEGDE